ncbi:MAG TPA: hypothetical protein VHD90_12335 [Phototrophicaceae bacterium]|nr:hypothetical protein [Phototrophicaceae bacterium]
MTAQALNSPPEFIKLLAHELRWKLVKVLTASDYRVQELVTFLDEPMNLVSYHLKKLRDDGVVTMRRSEADARDVYYSLDLGNLRHLYQAAGIALHPAFASGAVTSPLPPLAPARVLFVCTHNSARSQMAEGLMRHASAGQIAVFSAGSQPTHIHPDAVQIMDALGIDIRDQRAKDVQHFANQPFDYVITVCDRAREICPHFPGEGEQIHWGFTDPVAITDTRERQRRFAEIAGQLSARIDYFLLGLAEQRPLH